MNENFRVEPQILQAKITQETAQIHWHELHKYFATGAVWQVAASLDLVAVAYALAMDDKVAVSQWLEQHLLQKVSDEQALAWTQQQSTVWAVVISPWVLVQQRELQS